MKNHVFKVHQNMRNPERHVLALNNLHWNITIGDVKELTDGMERLTLTNGWLLSSTVGPILYTISITTHPELFI